MKRLHVTLATALLALTLGVPPGAAQQKLFDFHSAFWTNLHHYLHAHARAGGAIDEPLPEQATDAERRQWTAAIDEYRTRYGKRSLLFDDELVKANAALARAESSATLKSVEVGDELRAVLERAAPIYRNYRWAAHDAANKRFIANVHPMIERHGAAIASRLAATFDARWPAPIRVDLVHDAGPPGNAYTISEPTHITIAASDPRHQGVASLEAVFHEASHRWDALLMKGVVDAARAAKVRAPGGLWHGLLFYNAGAIVTEALAGAGTRDYVMYMEKEGMWDRAYRGLRPAITSHWSEFLAGRITRDEAIRRIVSELPAAKARLAGEV